MELLLLGVLVPVFFGTEFQEYLKSVISLKTVVKVMCPYGIGYKGLTLIESTEGKEYLNLI